MPTMQTARGEGAQPIDTGRRPGVRRRADVWALVAGGAVVCTCMVAVRHGDVSAWEAAVFRSINGLPDWLRPPMWTFQLFGMLATVAAVAAIAATMRRRRLALAVATAIPLKLALEWWVVKALVERERPLYIVPDVIVREVNSARLGFPSGHAVFAFALAGLLAPYVPRRGRIVLYALAMMNGVARIYLGSHNPLDIVAGAGLGIAIAAALNLALTVPAPRLEREPDPNRLRAR